MKRRWSLVFILTLILHAASARAELPVGANAPEINAKEWLNVDEPLKLSEFRGMVVCLYFWVTFHEGGEQVIGLMNAVENNPRFGRQQGVAVIGLTDADRKRAEPMLKDEKISFPVAVETTAHKDYQVSRFPSIAIIDPAGKIAYVGLPESGDELVKKVQETIEKTPPHKTHPLEVPKVRARLEEARKAIRSEDFRAAFRSAREALETAVRGDSLKTQCQEMVDLVEAIGRDRLAGADVQLEAKEFGQAVSTLRFVARQFRGTDPGRSARQRLEGYKKQFPEIEQFLAAEEKENAAKSKLLEAQGQLRGRDFAQAYESFAAVGKEFPNTEAAESAKRIRERMEGHALIMAQVREHTASKDCEAWLSEARTAIRTGRYPRARELLNQIRDKYADTKYADEAGRELLRLK